MEAEFTVDWPEEPLPELGDPEGLPADRLLDELKDLWKLLGETVRRTGPGCLWPGALRWGEGWQIVSILPPGATTKPVPTTPGAKERDAWTVASALFAVAAGRSPRDVADAVALLDLQAGVFPQGLDAIVNAILDGGEPARIYAALRPKTAPARITVRAAVETAIGSRKSQSNPLWDNEDAFTTVRTPGGGLALAVCDGVTGSGDGSGAEAARAAVKVLYDCLAEDSDVQIALGATERVVLRDTKGASTAVVALVHPDGHVDLASLGDSSAWLVRPLRGSGHLAARLTPAQTVLAEKLMTDPTADRHGSRLTRHLGGEAEQPYLGTFRAVPGDRIALLSDGAATTDGETWFGADLAALATDHTGPAGLAAALVGRAERLGGHDNATALIAEIRALD
jgi:serine/threonine protein phosphatase PrpC